MRGAWQQTLFGVVLYLQLMSPPKKRGAHRASLSSTNAGRRHQCSLQTASSGASVVESCNCTIPAQSEQEILTVFRRTFAHVFTNTLNQSLQEIKGHLYNRNYLTAFGSEEYLQAYAVRWSPSRALAYRTIFLDTCMDVRRIFNLCKESSSLPMEIVCIGGGAGAEVVGAAAAMRDLAQERWKGQGGGGLGISDKGNISVGEGDTPRECGNRLPRLHITAIDISPWSTILSSIITTLTTPYKIQSPFIPPNTLSVTFAQGDILLGETASKITKSTSLITLLFTTNELFTQSTAKATAFISSLGDRVSIGALLMVVESAGDYSTVKVGEREYPMPWLLDLILVGRQDKESTGAWKKLVAEDSNWYRLPKGKLKYPIELENMRYMVRVYQRL